MVEINNIIDSLMKSNTLKMLRSFKLAITSSPGTFINEEDKKIIFKKIVALIKLNKFETLQIHFKFLSDKDKISLGELIFRTIT